MKVEFKQAACFGGQDYKKGTHEVPEEILSNSYFNAMKKAGLIVPAKAGAEVEPKSFLQKQHEMLGKPPVKGESKPAPVDESPVEEIDEPTELESELEAEFNEEIEEEFEAGEEEHNAEESEHKPAKKKAKKKVKTQR